MSDFAISIQFCAVLLYLLYLLQDINLFVMQLIKHNLLSYWMCLGDKVERLIGLIPSQIVFLVLTARGCIQQAKVNQCLVTRCQGYPSCIIDSIMNVTNARILYFSRTLVRADGEDFRFQVIRWWSARWNSPFTISSVMTILFNRHKIMRVAYS